MSPLRNLIRQASGRWFYNGKVWWTNPDSFHVYAGGLYSYEQAKVHASFCSIASNLSWVGEPFVEYENGMPEDRLDIIRRVAPTTADTAIPVDMFENNPARLWNMPINRPFGSWNVVALFNYNYDRTNSSVTQKIELADLGLDANSEYLAFEFWNKQFVGTVKESFNRTLPQTNCEVFSIVKKENHPVLLATNRHVRNMAYDITNLKWDDKTKTLSGTSAVVKNDPYSLYIYAPKGYVLKGVTAENEQTTNTNENSLYTVSFTSVENKYVDWKVSFKKE